MNPYRPIRPVLIVVALAVFATVEVARAQEQARELTGSVVTGYSQNDLNGDSVHGPYLGLQADLKGYWKDPRILMYEFAPNFSQGTQWSGPVAGPDTTGFLAQSTFLAGSNIPLSVYFALQHLPTTQLSGLPNSSAETYQLRSLSRAMDSWGVDWQRRSRGRLPTLTVHYSSTNTRDSYPLFLGGELNTRNRNFTVTSGQRLAGWDLNAHYTNLTNSAESPFTLDANGEPVPQKSRQQQATGSATHKLPFRSHILLNADWTNNSLSIVSDQPPTHNQYSRFMGSFSTNFWSRLSLGSSASYISSYSDYWRSNIQAGGGGFLAQPGLGNSSTAVVSIGETATFRMTKTLSANGSYNAMRPVDVQGADMQPTTSYGGGLTYIDKLWGGDTSANYQFTRSESRVVSSSNESQSSVTSHSVSGSYTRALPLAIRSRSTAFFSISNLEQNLNEQFRTVNLSTTLERRLAQWTAEWRLGFGKQHIDYAGVNDSTNLNIGFAMRSRRMQANATYVHVSGLAYFFGTTLVNAPITEVIVPEINYLVRTTGNNLNITGTYAATKKLEIQGGFLRGNRSASRALPTAYTSYNVIATYRFRKLIMVAGYVWNGQHVEHGTSDYYGRQIYFQLKREFRLF